MLGKVGGRARVPGHCISTLHRFPLAMAMVAVATMRECKMKVHAIAHHCLPSFNFKKLLVSQNLQNLASLG